MFALLRRILYGTWGIGEAKAIEAARQKCEREGWMEWWNEPVEVVPWLRYYCVRVPHRERGRPMWSLILRVDARTGEVAMWRDRL